MFQSFYVAISPMMCQKFPMISHTSCSSKISILFQVLLSSQVSLSNIVLSYEKVKWEHQNEKNLNLKQMNKLTNSLQKEWMGSEMTWSNLFKRKKKNPYLKQMNKINKQIKEWSMDEWNDPMRKKNKTK
jgi:hypothetical protein